MSAIWSTEKRNPASNSELRLSSSHPAHLGDIVLGEFEHKYIGQILVRLHEFQEAGEESFVNQRLRRDIAEQDGIAIARGQAAHDLDGAEQQQIVDPGYLARENRFRNKSRCFDQVATVITQSGEGFIVLHLALRQCHDRLQVELHPVGIECRRDQFAHGHVRLRLFGRHRGTCGKALVGFIRQFERVILLLVDRLFLYRNMTQLILETRRVHTIASIEIVHVPARCSRWCIGLLQAVVRFMRKRRRGVLLALRGLRRLLNRRPVLRCLIGGPAFFLVGLLRLLITWQAWHLRWRCDGLLVLDPRFKVGHGLGHLLDQGAQNFNFSKQRVDFGAGTARHGVFHAREPAFEIADILVQIRHALFKTVDRLTHRAAVACTTDQQVDQDHGAHERKRQGNSFAERPSELEDQNCRRRQRDHGHANCYEYGPCPPHGIRKFQRESKVTG